MFIEDEELRNIFKSASEEHLQKLDDGFLHLENNPDNQAKLEELLREAHSLKGDAGMLGVKDVSTLAHQIEHILGSVKRGETQLSPEVSDRLSHGLNAIRKLVHEAVTGEPSGIVTFYVLARMMGANPEAPAEPTPTANNGHASQPDIPAEPLDNSEELNPEQTEETAAPEPPAIAPQLPALQPVATNGHSHQPQADVAALTTAPSPVSENLSLEHQLVPTFLEQQKPLAPNSNGKTEKWQNLAPTPQKTYRIDTIRVETRHLDSLMIQTGELTVTKVRINHRLAEIEEVATLWEEWSRDTFLNRFALEEVETRLAPSTQQHFGKNALSQLQQFHHRAESRLERLGTLINRLRNAVYEDSQRLDLVANELEEGIRTLRLLPLSTIFNLFPRMVRDLARQEGKEVALVIEGGDTKADKRILEEMKDPLMHMIRNCIDHGIETPAEREQLGKPCTATVLLRGYQTATNVIIEAIDDGRGLNLEKIKQTALKRGLFREDELIAMTPAQIQSLIFEPGFSTRSFVTEVSGRGVGLDVVRTNVEQLKGTIQVESVLGRGCTIRVQLPTTLATAHVLIVAVQDISYAIPVESVQTARFVSSEDIFTIEGRDTILFDSIPVSVARLGHLLELKTEDSGFRAGPQGSSRQQAFIPCIILKVGEELLGLLVDAVLDEQDIMLKPQSLLLKRVRNVAGATILGTGEVCMVLNPQDLIKSVRKQAVSLHLPTLPYKEEPQNGMKTNGRKQAILLVEDSIATRTQEKRILEEAGYEVVTAVDGLDGYNKLKTRSFDAVVSDVQMPNLDGLGLTASIRQHKEYSELPIILVTSLGSDEDKRRGAEAGANAYITKGTFNQEVLLDTLRRLV